MSKQPYLQCFRSGRTAGDQITPHTKELLQGSDAPARETQAPLKHNQPQGGQTQHNHGRGSHSSRVNRTACKAAHSGASILAHTDSQPEAEAAKQPGFNRVTGKLWWSEGWALLEVKAGQQALSAGVCGLVTTGTPDVDMCGGSCTHTTTHQGTATLDNTCSSTHPNFKHTDISGTMGENKKACTDGVIKASNPNTRGESNVGSSVVVTEPCATNDDVKRSDDCCLSEVGTSIKTCEGMGMHSVADIDPCTVEYLSVSEQQGAARRFRRRLICQLHILGIAFTYLTTGMVMGRIDELWATLQGPAWRHLSKEATSLNIRDVFIKWSHGRDPAPSTTWAPIHTGSAQSGWPEDSCFSVWQLLAQNAHMYAELGAHVCSSMGSHGSSFAAGQHLVSGVYGNGSLCEYAQTTHDGSNNSLRNSNQACNMSI